MRVKRMSLIDRWLWSGLVLLKKDCLRAKRNFGWETSFAKKVCFETFEKNWFLPQPLSRGFIVNPHSRIKTRYKIFDRGTFPSNLWLYFLFSEWFAQTSRHEEFYAFAAHHFLAPLVNSGQRTGSSGLLSDCWPQTNCLKMLTNKTWEYVFSWLLAGWDLQEASSPHIFRL